MWRGGEMECMREKRGTKIEAQKEKRQAGRQAGPCRGS